MLFSDTTLRKRVALAIPPPTPDSGWHPPRDFPNLSSAKIIGLDCEVKENDFERGPGWSRNQSSIVGVSISAWSDNYQSSWYFPIGHEVEKEYNLDRDRVFSFLNDVLRQNHPKVGANLVYDLGNLSCAGVQVNGPLYDCQFAEALLDETGEVNLDYLGLKYLEVGKETNQLYEWLRLAYGDPKYDQRENIWRASPRLVGPYAERDASHPIQVLMKQWPLLEQQNLLQVFDMECRLIRLIIRMRMEGVRVDIPATEKLYGELGPLMDAERLKLKEMTGLWANVNPGSQDVPKIFDRLKLTYPRTAKGAPSFQGKWLEAHEHPVAKLIVKIRNLDKMRETFLKSYILEANVNGRIHGQFHLLRGDDDGTRSGRLSGSTPNLQNIPARSEIGKRIRSLFVPDVGHSNWVKGDFSQIEYRLLVHYAVGQGADEVRAQYNRDPSTDYHRFTQKLVREVAGITIPRNAEEAAASGGEFGTLTIKEINFGLLYGMGEGKLGRMAKLNREMQGKVFKAYHAGAPYVKATMDATADEINQLGHVTTIMMRRSRFNEWEPAYWSEGGRQPSLPLNAAIAAYGTEIKRAGIHKGINRRLQGSAADVLKRGMLMCEEGGVYAAIGTPRLTVHDEMDHSRIDMSPYQTEAYKEMERIMQESTPLQIPIKFDVSEGPNWGACK